MCREKAGRIPIDRVEMDGASTTLHMNFSQV
jgi:hypothetical protein